MKALAGTISESPSGSAHWVSRMVQGLKTMMKNRRVYNSLPEGRGHRVSPSPQTVVGNGMRRVLRKVQMSELQSEQLSVQFTQQLSVRLTRL